MGPCRVCLNLNDCMQNIYEKLFDATQTVALMLSSIVNYEISKENGLPEFVCITCFKSIINAYELKIQFEKSEAVLREAVNNLSNKIEDSSIDCINSNETILIVLPELKRSNEDLTINNNIINENDTNNDNLVGILLENFCDNVDYKSECNDFDDDFESEFTISQDESEIFHKNNDNNIEELNIKNIDNDDLNKYIEYECTMCHQSFINEGELKLHMGTHPKGTRHVCKICSKSYKKRCFLIAHNITHMKNKNFKCIQCDKTFYHIAALNSHMIYHSEKKYVCSLCNIKFYRRYSLINHLKGKHTPSKDVDSKDLECTMCNKRFFNLSTLREHKKMHPKGTKHYCKDCGKSYLSLTGLQRHVIIHTDKKSYLCNFCGKSFTQENLLKAHMIYHYEKKHKCSFCEKKFHRLHKLREHIRIWHSNEKFNCMCEICGKLCTSTRRLDIHKSSHSSISCPVCGKNYRNMRCYKNHMKMHNGDVVKKKSFICDYCGEVKHLKTSLELHILSRHLKERRYVCHVCNKGFYSKGSLSEHNVVHNRLKMVKCDFCGKLLVNKKALILHKRLHTGERPYPCYICGQRFLSSSRRMVHQKIKHGERTVFCQLCPSKFYLQSDLNKHMLVHTKKPKALKKDTSQCVI